MSGLDRVIKRVFDIVLSLFLLVPLFTIICLLVLIATIETKQIGIFNQVRVGQYGKLFKIYKIRTMIEIDGIDTFVTTINDKRITKSGRVFRKYKLDELPQIINVLLGEMSFVGPRPDVPGFADKLEGEDKIILSIKPGVTGPATIFFRDEELLLSKQTDPEQYNDEIIWPQKVAINKKYIEEYSLSKDIRYILKTIF